MGTTMRAMCEHSGPVLEGSVAGPDPYAVSGIDPVKSRPRHLERERPMPSMNCRRVLRGGRRFTPTAPAITPPTAEGHRAEFRRYGSIPPLAGYPRAPPR